MDPKNKDVNRLIASNETEKVPRLKGKEKARKELWDSLCAVYENEADKENDEVALSDLEEWTVTNADSSMRALTHLATTNPQILSAAVPTFIGKADLLGLESVEKEELYEKKVKVRKISKKCRCDKLLPDIKSNKIHSPSVKCKNNKLLSPKKKLSQRLMREGIIIEDNKSKLKKQHKENNDDVKNSKISPEKRKRKEKLKISENNKGINKPKAPNSSNHSKVQLNVNKETDSSHGCKLENRFYIDSTNVSSRPDGRVFNCKLIFKVCHCSYSDVIL